MAFNLNKMYILTNPSNADVLSCYSYTTSTDNSTVVKAANYFVGSRLNVGDLIICKTTDGVLFLQVSTITANGAGITSAVTVVAYTLS